MPFHLNVCHIAGTLTRDPEVKYTPKGTPVCEIGLAINHVYYSGEEKREETVFLDCEAWGRTAEIIGEHTGKGHTIMVEGRLKQDTWEDKQTGQKRSKLKLSVEKFHFVSKPRGESDGEAPPRQQRQQQRASAPSPASNPPPRDPDLDPPDDDDIPF